MGFKEVIQKMGARNKARKETFKRMQEQDQLETMLGERKKSANQREYERFIKENQEEEIKEALKVLRNKRRDDIAFNHNPLHTKNIMKSQWEILKEKNQFGQRGNMFKNQEFIHKNNKCLLKNGNVLHNNSSIMNQGGGLI